MSGVVYGLFGYVFIRSKVDFVSEYFIDRRDVILSVVWLFLCTTELIGPIANAAHFGGLFIGLGWGYVDALLSRRRQ
jgi:GlpG protein